MRTALHVLPRRMRRLLPCTLLAFAGSCDAVKATKASVPIYSIARLSGDSQTGPAGETLPIGLAAAVRVIDEKGFTRNVSGAQVTFAVTSGGGTLLTEAGRGPVLERGTNNDGITGVTWILGPVAGVQTVSARVTDGSAAAVVTFTATASAAVGSIVIAPDGTQLLPGERASFTTRRFDTNGNAMATGATEFTPLDPTLIQIVAADQHLGTVTVLALAPGNARLVASSSGKSDTTIVRVNAPVPPVVPVASVLLTPETVTLDVGRSAPLAAVARDAQGTTLPGRIIVYASTNTSIATVTGSGGSATVVGVAAGEARVIATSDNNRADTSRITVRAVPTPVTPIASLVLTPETVTIDVGATGQLAAEARDAQGTVLTGRTIIYSSTNTGIATVTGSGTSATVRGLAAGEARVIATTDDGKSDTSRIIVRAVIVPVTPVASLVLTPETATIDVGATGQLTVVTRDAQGNALTGRTVTYTSTNGSVASVTAGGLVRGEAPGEASVIATAEGKADTARITVRAAAVACVAGQVCTVVISTSNNATAVQVGHTLFFQTILRDASGTQLTSGQTVTYTTSNSAVARVEEAPPGGPPGYFANIRGVSAGQATITATANGRSGSVTITVTP